MRAQSRSVLTSTHSCHRATKPNQLRSPSTKSTLSV